MKLSKNRQALERRISAQGGRCAYCRNRVFIHQVETGDLGLMATWDEIVPRAHGGTTQASNRVVACYRCNQKKSHRHVHDFMPGWSPDPIWNLIDD